MICFLWQVTGRQHPANYGIWPLRDSRATVFRSLSPWFGNTGTALLRGEPFSSLASLLSQPPASMSGSLGPGAEGRAASARPARQNCRLFPDADHADDGRLGIR